MSDSHDPLVFPQDEFDLIRKVVTGIGNREWTPEQVREFGERFRQMLEDDTPEGESEKP